METTELINVMTKYEKISVLLSIVAIAISILVPLVQWIWKKWIIRAKLNYLQTGYGYLFINQSGSYIRIESVYEALNKPISIKGISLNVVRKRDNQQRNFSWVAFTSPTNMQFVGANASAVEIAHPFRIEADNVFCAFTEFGEADQNAFRTLLPYYESLKNKAKELKDSGLSYDLAIERYMGCKEYNQASEKLKEELFWVIDKYTATITAAYGKTKEDFILTFEVTTEQFNLLEKNMKESIIIPLKDTYGIPRAMQTVQIHIDTK